MIALIKRVADYYGVDVKDVIGNARHKQVIYARHIAMYVLSKKARMSQEDIAKQFMGDGKMSFKNRSSVSSGIERIESLAYVDSVLRKDLEKIMEGDLENMLSPDDYRTIINNRNIVIYPHYYSAYTPIVLY